MATCCRCKANYREPPGEEGDHRCPKCGLSPEVRQLYVYTAKGWVPREKEDEDNG